jgi:hypothetical protein
LTFLIRTIRIKIAIISFCCNWISKVNQNITAPTLSLFGTTTQPITFTVIMKGGAMGETYLMQRGAATAHLPVLAVHA